MDWSHFGLDRQPFRAAVDPDSYYSSPSHEAALAAIASAFARRDSVVFVDGPAGVGKSLVARKWLEHLLAEVPRVLVPNAHAERPVELLQAILFDLAKPYQGLSEQELRLAATDHLLQSAAATGYPMVVVLDEAQHLSQMAFEELRLLGNLETRAGSAIFVLLVAQPQLRDTIRQPGYELLAQRIAAYAAIEPLTLDQSADYLRHQLRAAGGEADGILDAEAISLISEACGGIPRLLNRAAVLALELAAGAEAKTADTEAALEALAQLSLSVETSESGGAEPVLLPHPSRAAEPAMSRREKAATDAGQDEGAGKRGPKEKSARKRSA